MINGLRFVSIFSPSLPLLLVGTKIEKTVDPKEVDQMRKGREAKCPGHPQMTNISSCTFNVLFKDIILFTPHSDIGIDTITSIFRVRKLRLTNLKGFE